MNTTTYRFLVREVADLDFEDNGEVTTTHWEVVRIHKMANGDTWHEPIFFTDTQAQAETFLCDYRNLSKAAV